MTTQGRPGNVVAASVVAASILVSAVALGAIAWFLGWIPDKPAASSPVSIAQPGSQLAGSAPDTALLPGESVVESESTPKGGPTGATAGVAPAATVPRSPSPTTPSYAKRAAPTAAPSPPSLPSPPPPAPPPPMQPEVVKPAGPAPITPSYARRAEPKRAEPQRVEPESLCMNCGQVSSVTYTADMWDVAVRFEDGSREVFRYPERPRLRSGDKVRLEDGRLEPDK